MTKKQRQRRERAARRAAALSGAATEAFGRAHDVLAPIPLGQPILVGHHSEARHRRDLEKHDRAMRRGVELHKRARSASASAQNSGRAITSDDPEAVVAIKEKLAGLEASRDAAKKINRIWNKSGDPEELAKALEEFSDVVNSRDVTFGLMHHGKPFPSYWLQNRGAEIRRLKKRLEQLQAEAERVEAEDIEGDGWTIEECKQDCRIRIIFDSRPSRETCKLLRSRGWKWAPSVGAWQRLLNDAGRRSAAELAKEL